MRYHTFALNRLIIALTTVTVVVGTSSGEDFNTAIAGAEYLHSAISDIRTKISEPVHGTIDWVYNKSKKRPRHPMRMTSVSPPVDTDRSGHYIPQPSLTNGELVALYDAALSNGGGGIIPATTTPEHPPIDDPNTGYYYYYYPLNTEADHNTQGQPLGQAQLHTHLHDVKIHTLDDDGGGGGGSGGAISGLIHNLQHGRYKALEPLFMAVSSFAGMAMMFLFSMIFMPRFGHNKSRSDVPIRPQPQTTSLSEVVLKAIDGQDCDERLFCEAGRVLRAFNLEENRFVKFFQRLAPTTFAKTIEKARRMANYNKKCIVIQCRKKKNDRQPPIRSRILPQPQRKNQQNKNIPKNNQLKNNQQKKNQQKNNQQKNNQNKRKPRRLYNNT